MSDHSNEHAATDRLPGYSEIMAFHMNHPRATPGEINRFTGEITARLCDCGNQMRRFEVWNGECVPCRMKRDIEGKKECGCVTKRGHRWRERGGWHYLGVDAWERCPKFWDRKEGEVEITATEGGVKVKRKATVRYYVDEADPRKIRRLFYDEKGRLIDRLSSRPENDKW